MTPADLPPPTGGGDGWPWTAPPASPPAAGGPRISVVTPSLDQAPFLEAALRSVLLQGYPDLEYLVLDGGSADGSQATIQRYAAHLAGWRSEPDGGQADAVNRGWRAATGEVLGWLNSDDLYLPGALARVADAFRAAPDLAMVYGDCEVWREPGGERHVVPARPLTLDTLVAAESPVCQPAAFYRRSAVAAAGWLDARLRYVMDRDLWLRLLPVGPSRYLAGPPLAVSREHADTKSGREYARFPTEFAAVLRRYRPRPEDARRYRRLRRRAIAEFHYALAYFAATRDRDYPRAIAWLVRALVASPGLGRRLPRAARHLARPAA